MSNERNWRRSGTHGKGREKLKLGKRLIVAAATLSLFSAGAALLKAVPLAGMVSAFAAQMSGSGSLSTILEASANVSRQTTVERLKELRGNPAVGSATKQEAAYCLARTLLKEKAVTQSIDDRERANEIIALFEEASRIQVLKERSLRHIVTVASQSGNEEVLRQALAALKAHTAKAETKAFADYTLGQSYTRTNEMDKAFNAFIEARKDVPRGKNDGTGANVPANKYYLAAGYYLAEAIIAAPQTTADQLTEAAQLLSEYISQSADGRFAVDCANRLSDLASKGIISLSVQDFERIGRAYFHQGRWQEALASWDKISDDTNPYYRTLCLTHLKRYEEAKEVLLRAIRSNPEKKSYMNAATVLANPLTRQQTLELWKDVLEANPVHADTPLWNIAIRLPPPESASYFRQILKQFPTSEFAPESAWWLFWHRVKSGDRASFPEAISMAQQAIKRYPKTKAAGRLLFWCGKLHERLGQKSLAIAAYRTAHEQFPNNYYGFRAGQRLAAITGSGPDLGWRIITNRAHPKPGWRWPESSQLSQEHTIAERFGSEFALLAKLRQYDECLELAPKGLLPATKAWLLASAERRLEAINTASRVLKGKPGSGGLWQTSYPLEFGAIIAENARAKNMDPLLVHALVREESRYNPQAVSRSNALGLMQLLPGTAYGVAKRIGVHLNGKEDVFKPEINLKLGTDYLDYALRRFSGNALMAVASYNGGPGAVQAWLKQHAASGSTDFDVFVENIPYRETRDYVRKVFNSFWAYNSVYAKTAVASEPEASEEVAEEAPGDEPRSP
ncbi:MAG TPA: transglycosylase SLT domain-containing protein [Candidatus Obscuribacterales bacterium]